MGMQHGPCSATVNDAQMQQGFCTCLACSPGDVTAAVHFDQFFGVDGSLVDAAGGHQQSQWLMRHHNAEIASSAIAPTPAMQQFHRG